MLGSSYFKGRALDQQTAEVKRLRNAETTRQSGMDQERMADLNANISKFGSNAQDADKGAIADKLRSYLTAPTQQTQPVDYQQQNPGAPAEIKAREDAGVAAAQAKGSEYAARLADMSAYGLLNFNTGVTMNRLGERQANFTASQKHSADILPIELQSVPFRVGRQNSTIADVLAGTGMIAGMGAFTPAAAPAIEGVEAGGTGLTLGATSPGLKIPPEGGFGLGLKAPSLTMNNFGGNAGFFSPPTYAFK